MHLPSSRVYKEMRSEDASLWIVPANGGQELAVLIKAPSSSIKGLIAGCRLSLVFGIHSRCLCAGARIFDMPDAPILISGAVKESEEQDAICRLLGDRAAPIFLFNEMDVCVAWTNLTLLEDEAVNVLKRIKAEPALYTGPFTASCSHALDCFGLALDPTAYYPEAEPIPTTELSIELEPWRANNVSFVSVRGYHTITINDHNEGEMFERAVWASLESVFPLTLYKSPQVTIGDKTREFTDVLAFHEYGSFLIEAKDLSVLEAGFERNQERRTKGVQKQAKKAIGQLVGACKALTRGDVVIDDKGTELSLVRDKPPHCIVLITELMHWGEWQEVEMLLDDAMRTTGGFFHLFDLREFIVLLKGSRGNPLLLDYNLRERCKIFAKHGSVFIRTRIAPSTATSEMPGDA
jgi:hypothetical protein